MFTMPSYLQKDPGESDKGGFERGNSLTMEDNDLYSSWRTGNARQSSDESNMQSKKINELKITFSECQLLVYLIYYIYYTFLQS